MVSAKTRSDREKLFHFWSKMKSQESHNKHVPYRASHLRHLILDDFHRCPFHKKVIAFESMLGGRSTDTTS